MIEHVVLEHKYSGTQGIKLLEEPYKNMIISFSKVEFEEDCDLETMHIKYNYEIHDSADCEYSKLDLEQYLGDFIMDLLEDGLKNHDIIYSGGVD